MLIQQAAVVRCLIALYETAASNPTVSSYVIMMAPAIHSLAHGLHIETAMPQYGIV